MANTFKSFKKSSLNNQNIAEIKTNITTNTENIETMEGYSFISYVQFNFQNNLIANELFIDNLDNRLYMTNLNGTEFNTKEKQIVLSNNVETGTCTTTAISGALGDAKSLNSFFLLDDSILPYGTYIDYFIIDDEGKEYPLKANNANPFVFSKYISNYKIKAKLTRNANRESPILKGIAVLCYDQVVEGTYGLTNPDLSRFTFADTSSTRLIRDRLNNDKLVRIEAPLTTTTLMYNEDGQLRSVITEDEFTISISYLNYGEYLDSSNKTVNTLLSTTAVRKLKNVGE